MRSVYVWCVALLVGLLLYFVTGTVAEAHAYLQSSMPADQSELKVAPENVVLTFTEMIQNEYPSIIVRDSKGNRVEKGKAFIHPENDHVVEVALQDGLADDVYSAEWHVVSADGHPVSGVISFKVGKTSQAFVTTNAADNTTASWPSTVMKVILYIGFSLIAGVILFFLALYRGEISAGMRRKTVWLLGAGLGLVLLGLLLFLPVQVQIYTGGDVWNLDAMLAIIRKASIGHLWLIQVAAFVLLFVSFAVMLGKEWFGRVWMWTLPAVFFAVILFAKAMQGHAAGSASKSVAIPMDFVHLVCASAWVGGIIVLFVLLAKEASASLVWNRFSPFAAVFVAGIIVSGLLMSVINLGSMASLFTTDYGRVILLKIALFALMGGLGLVHYLYMRNTGKLVSGKTVIAEFCVGLVLLGVAAVLTNVQTPPPKPPEAFSEKTATKTGFVSLKIMPAVVGDNTFLVVFTDKDGQVRTDFQKVTLTAIPRGNKRSSTFEAKKNAQNQYVATGLYLNAPGRWKLEVHALTEDFVPIDETFTVTIKGN
ncbi:copper resistance protein [Listeria booriae]|uniref:Copper resistance protein n=1 Tax=Listeria booriae TaxID=1552123 RepID=A0A842FKF2_9LIST|nr:copper resistance CopC/CopD family protein [Listeria booriae]MBC2282990.1 copper resistance protein [Listeria booriae]MBC2291981.1 copper resistance protein [Listeria booriae]